MRSPVCRVLFAAALGALLLIVGLTVWASADTAGVLTVPVDDTLTLYGVAYKVTGTLTLTPVPPLPPPLPPPVPLPVVPPVPPPVPPPIVPSPTVNEFRDPTRQFAVSALVGGGNHWIYGSRFGAVPGTLTAASAALPILHWDDSWIQFTAPAFMAGAPAGMWTIIRADGSSSGGYYSFTGPTIIAPP